MKFNNNLLAAYLQTSAGEGGVAALIVTVEDGVASCTASDIYQHLQQGGVAVLFDGNAFCNLSHCDGSLAYFMQFNDDFCHYVHMINDSGVYECTEMAHARQAELGVISAALDSIIALQDELVGGTA